MQKAKEELSEGDIIDLHFKDKTHQTLLYINTPDYSGESHFIMADPEHEHFGKKVLYSDSFGQISHFTKLGNLERTEWHDLAKSKQVLKRRLEEMRKKSAEPEWLQEFL